MSSVKEQDTVTPATSESSKDSVRHDKLFGDITAKGVNFVQLGEPGDGRRTKISNQLICPQIQSPAFPDSNTRREFGVGGEICQNQIEGPSP